MVKTLTQYICQMCGSCFPKWSGKCEGCQSWNSLIEEAASGSFQTKTTWKAKKIDFSSLEDISTPLPRLLTGIEEFDRVCGGGLVPGSVILVGGDPGIGKSTLLLQVAATISEKVSCAYISGEEAADQVRLRAKRLKVSASPVQLATTTHIGEILKSLHQDSHVAVIDSIQTMYVDALDATPGSVSQVRASAHELIRFAKKYGVTIIIVGHVTKEGVIAGPRVLEHMVDTVLYFEGERGHHFRILRSVKNRFGPTDEIGVFEMTDKGLLEVPNPSALFLPQREDDVTGSCVFAGIEGTRPLLVEIQSLISPSSLATPRRAVVGWDSARLAMILAVLEARCGLASGNRDVFLNVAGGLRISEPAADLAVAAALLSSLANFPVPKDAVFFGEIGLSGEIRPVNQQEARLKEAFKLGFKTAFIPKPTKPLSIVDMALIPLAHLAELANYLEAKPKTRKAYGG
ncbi:MAG: DNA repair protein RadA [Alphaproteobacteria bacterium]|nr:DNA repair protein RadA [Alphaproteobacteria bacterium]